MVRDAVGRPLRGHPGDMYSVAYSPDGMHITSGSWDTTIQIWDVELLKAPLRSVIVFSPEGRYIISGSEDCTIHVLESFPHASIQRSSSGNPVNPDLSVWPDSDGWVRDPEGLLGIPRLLYRPEFTYSPDNPSNISYSISFS
jgi:WD40 repeat protein